jgi:hypothetical protein
LSYYYIDGNADHIEAGTHNRISITSPQREYQCNIPETIRKTTCIDFEPRIMVNTTSKGEGQEQSTNNKDQQEKQKETNKKNNGDNNNSNEGNNNDANKEHHQYGREENGDKKRGGNGGRVGRGGRGWKTTERKQIPRVEWETYDFAISFDPQRMKNKDPDAEFQAVLLQIMKKSPGVVFHPTNEDMYPKPQSFSHLQGYPQTKAAFNDFFEVYENKGLIIYKIYIQATMQYDELQLRHSLLNYLKSDNLWMTSELISESVDEMIGFVNYGHDKLVWRPDRETKINNGIKALIQSKSISTALK